MKTFRILLFVMAGLSLSTCSRGISHPGYAPRQAVSLQLFYTELGPYGVWMDYAPYGYVWVPNVSRSFSPYLTNGHWVYTGFGWTWYSYYRWGWAPFHYGRWHYDVAYGWIWLPDTVWGPAWVVWRHGGGYCGWAPLDFGITLQIAMGPGLIVPHEHWIFIPERDLPKRNIDRRRIDHARNSELVERASVTREVRRDRETVYTPGPARADVEQYTGATIRELKVNERTTPGASRVRRNTLEIYRPEVVPERGETPPDIYRAPDGERPAGERKVRTRPQPAPRREVAPPPDQGEDRDIAPQRQRQAPPPSQREQEIRRQPERQTQPQKRPSRTVPPKKKSTDDDQVNRGAERNRRN